MKQLNFILFAHLTLFTKVFYFFFLSLCFTSTGILLIDTQI